MSELQTYRALGAVLLAVLVAVYAIARAPDNGKPPGGPELLTLDEGLDRLVWQTEPKPVVETPFLAPDGTETTFAAFKGKVVLVNFWATWCSPCLAEMPELARAGEAAGPDVTVVAISIDRKQADAAAWLKEQKIALPAYGDPKAALWTALGESNLPVTLILDREGRELARLPRPGAWGGEKGLAILREAARRAGPAAPVQ